jgi:hypothetical protein
MRYSVYGLAVGSVFSLILFFGISQAGATTVVYTSFPTGTPGLALNGSAIVGYNNGIDSTPVLQLVPASGSRSGSAFSQTMLNASSFSAAFTFRITNPGGGTDPAGSVGADGLVFVVQSVSSSQGSTGGGIGYAGIQHSVGIEFDTWQNTEYGDPSSNHIGIDQNGSMTSLTAVNISPDNFDNHQLWYAWVDYNDATQTLEVRANETGVRPTAPTLSRSGLNLTSILGQTNAYVGFTAGTGGDYENSDIVSFQYNDSYNPIVGATIPEPLTMAGLMLGIGGLAGYIRKRRTA